MMLLTKSVVLAFYSVTSFANPYWDQNAVPKDPPYHPKEISHIRLNAQKLRAAAPPIVRVDVVWEKGEKYSIERVVTEKSGTPALLARAKRKDPLGSYKGELRDSQTGEGVYFDSVGTGAELRLLTRAMTFRFPFFQGTKVFVLFAENPVSGVMEEVLRETLNSKDFRDVNYGSPYGTPAGDPEVRLIKRSTSDKPLLLSIHADGYVPSQGGTEEKFYQDAQRVADSLISNKFPGVEKFDIIGVFAASRTAIGKAKDQGLPVPDWDSYLGLYYPYWDNFGRWYNVVYPTREKKLRDGLGSLPYDYPLVLIDNGDYWGVGNFNQLTAIPNKNSSFTYLLTHEFGHYFGLNEEYEGGGKTELAFAPKIEEPWSQNMTFHPTTPKWKHLLLPNTPLPTPKSIWKGKGPYGAYRGGYADTEPFGKNHKPGYNCTMTSGGGFCPICTEAIHKKLRFDSGDWE